MAGVPERGRGGRGGQARRSAIEPAVELDRPEEVAVKMDTPKEGVGVGEPQ
jgi:hypothetical protein